MLILGRFFVRASLYRTQSNTEWHFSIIFRIIMNSFGVDTTSIPSNYVASRAQRNSQLLLIRLFRMNLAGLAPICDSCNSIAYIRLRILSGKCASISQFIVAKNKWGLFYVETFDTNQIAFSYFFIVAVTPEHFVYSPRELRSAIEATIHPTGVIWRQK